jgi:chemotaxis protein MotB
MSTACVKKSTHRVALTSLEDARSDIATLENEVATLETEQAELTREMQAEQQRRDSVESALHVALSRTEADRRAEVERLNTLLMQQGTDYNALRARLQSLAAVEQEVRERNAIYENVIARFRSLMDGGQLSVAIERGRLVILLPQDVLFESGSATLGQEGRRVIAEVARVLAGFPDRQFQVEGHTDNVPIATERFPSNWELSSARALAVVRLLTQNGVVPGNVSGAAYGEFQPVAPNEDRDARRRNRRIEIVMLPNLDLIAETELPGNR